MTSNDATPQGYRIVGPCDRDRRLVDYELAFAAYADCDDRAQIDEQGFLSPFQYSNEIRERDQGHRLDVRGFDGVVWSKFLMFDIDDADLDNALDRTRRLCSLLIQRYDLDESELLVFFSGGKGFHVGLPTSVFDAEPSAAFNRICLRLAERLAAEARTEIDPVVYQKVQPLRAPNSRHGKTNRYKRLVSIDELVHLRADSIKQRAGNPLPFEVPDDPGVHGRAVEDWTAACEQVAMQTEATRQFSFARNELNRSTLEFVRDGADQGDRHRLLYSAAANLFELGCPLRLAHALLTESALDSGLAPSDIRRAIDNAHHKLNGGVADGE